MELTYWKSRLDAWLDSRLPEMLAMLETMVNMDTSSHSGAEVNKLGEWVTGRMRESGFATLKLPRPPVPEDEPWRAALGNVFSAWSHEPGRGIILPGHLDTVFPDGTTASWRFAMDADKATGPGVADMKGGLLLNIFAVRALKETGLLDFPVTLTFSCDEELGSVTSSCALREYVTGGWAAVSSEPAREWGSVINRSKGSGHLRLRVDGKGAHSSMDYESGASAILELARKTLELDRLVDSEREIVVNTGLFSGGTSAGTVAPWAESGIHLSYAHLSDGRAALEEIRNIVARTHVPGTRSRLSGGIRLPPLEENERNKQLFSLVREAGGAAGIKVRPVYAKWASEAGLFSSLGVPSVCGMGPVGGGFHTAEEFLLISSLLPRCKMLALTILQAARVFRV